jgi:FkbM family methyltransferase
VRVARDGYEFDVDPVGYENFWRWFQEDWEGETFRVFDAFLPDVTTYLDVGAWIGPTLLSAACRVERAVGFEPDPVAFAALERNVARNFSLGARITLVPAAVGARSGRTRLGSRTTPGDSMSSVLFGTAEHHWTASVVRLDEFAAREGLKPPFFLKCDIEGGEYSLLPALAPWIGEVRPTLYLSLHPEFLVRAAPDGEELAALERLAAAHEQLATILGGYRHLFTGEGAPIAADTLRNLRTIVSMRQLVVSDRPWA